MGARIKMHYFVGVLLLLTSPWVVLASPAYYEPAYCDYGEYEGGNVDPQPLAPNYFKGPGASADPLCDVYDGLDDDAKWDISNLAMEQGPGKRGTRGLLLKKLAKKLLAKFLL